MEQDDTKLIRRHDGRPETLVTRTYGGWTKARPLRNPEAKPLRVFARSVFT